MIASKGEKLYRNPKNSEKGSQEDKRHNNRPTPDKEKRSSTAQQTVCGMRPVMEALDAGLTIDKVMLQSNLDGSLSRELRAKLREAEVPFQFVPVEKLARVAKGNHQGVVALVSPIKYHSFVELASKNAETGKSSFMLLLDHVTDVRNLGAIVRTAECAGIDAVVVPAHGSAQINEEAIKSSSGALLRMPICRESNLKTVINFAHQTGMQVCAATEKATASYLEADFTKPTLLVMGSEEAGISPELLKMCDIKAKLPILGQVQSLNVSVAAAIFMYEMLRQRGAK